MNYQPGYLTKLAEEVLEDSSPRNGLGLLAGGLAGGAALGTAAVAAPAYLAATPAVREAKRHVLSEMEIQLSKQRAQKALRALELAEEAGDPLQIQRFRDYHAQAERAGSFDQAYHVPRQTVQDARGARRLATRSAGLRGAGLGALAGTGVGLSALLYNRLSST